MSDENVVEFPVPAWRKSANELDAELDEAPIRRAPRDYEACKHVRTVVEEQARRVTCRACKAELDPITVLVMLANEPDRYIRTIKDLHSTADDLSRRVRDLERAERNAKSRIRSARARRDDDEAVEAAARASLVKDGWDALDADRRRTLIARVRPVCEAYIAALG